VIHTNQKHPFFTLEHGFLPVGQIKLGMHLLRADGRVGVVTGWKVVPGTKTMYNLEVANDHTYTVGAGQWVVHNWNCNADARAIAKKIQRLLRKKGGDMISTTVGVGFTQSGIPKIAMNDTWPPTGDNTGLLQDIVRNYFPGADYVGPTAQIPASADALHAEDYILNDGEGLIGIGTSNSNGICDRCAARIVSAFPDLAPGLRDWP
jgi:hypothetical protein